MIGKVTGVLLLTVATSLASYASDWGYQRDRRDDRGYQRQRYQRYEQRRYRPQADYRETFVYSNQGGGSFSYQGDGTWVETNAAGADFSFREVRRTPEHIELYDDSRNIGALLGLNMSYYDDVGDGRWKPMYQGRWR